jgi:hypothetical protein
VFALLLTKFIPEEERPREQACCDDRMMPYGARIEFLSLNTVTTADSVPLSPWPLDVSPYGVGNDRRPWNKRAWNQDTSRTCHHPAASHGPFRRGSTRCGCHHRHSTTTSGCNFRRGQTIAVLASHHNTDPRNLSLVAFGLWE